MGASKVFVLIGFTLAAGTAAAEKNTGAGGAQPMGSGAEALVSASDPQSVVTAMQALGHAATLGADSAGNPLVSGEFAGTPYDIFFYGCTANADCQWLLFEATADLANGWTLEAANEWNGSQLVGQLYLNDTQDPVLNHFVTTLGGVSQTNFGDVLDRWHAAVEEFRTITGAPPDAPVTTQGEGQDDPEALFNRGVAYRDGQGVPQDHAEAVRLFRLAAEQGHASAQNDLGYAYEMGEGVPQDYAEAARLYRLAADQGHPWAQSNLAILYENGRGVPQDYAEAARWYRLAADQGNATGQTGLGYLHFNGLGVPQDHAEAARLYSLAAAQGDAVAQSNLGYMYDTGTGVPQNQAEAVRLYRLAADQGNAVGQSNLGYMYENGLGVPQDYAEAARWYRLAADQGDVTGQAGLGYLYETGQGLPQDYAEAARWYRLAAEGGNAIARTNLGILYENGTGVPQDYAEAARFYRLGAEAGDPQGEWNLGGLYALGRGVPQDLAQAAKLRLSAFAQGNAWARSLLIDERGSRLGVEERREMQRVLQSRGLYSGPLDGEFSPAVIAALEAFAPG